MQYLEITTRHHWEWCDADYGTDGKFGERYSVQDFYCCVLLEAAQFCGGGEPNSYQMRWFGLCRGVLQRRLHNLE